MNREIAYVLKGYPRLSETFIAQEIYMLEQKGYKISIISMRKAREKEKQPIVDMIQARVTYVPEYIWESLGTVVRENLKIFKRRPTVYLKLLAQAIFKSFRIQDVDPIKRFLQAGWCVGREKLGTLQSPVHHFHSHFIHAPTEMTTYMAALTGLTYSISAHAKDIYTIPEKEVCERINNSQFLMTCTGFNFEFLRRIPKLKIDRVNLVYHGINLQNFFPSEQTVMPAEGPIPFITIGRLVEKKGYPDLLEACALLKNKGYRFQYDIYGAGEMKAELSEMITRLHLSDCVTLHGHATHPQLIERMKRKGLFLNASFTTESGDRDGIPNTLAEAMAMGLPVVATRVSGIPELIQDGIHGLLVEPRNVQALAAAIERLLTDSALVTKLSHMGRKRVEEVFDSERCIDRCDQLLSRFK